MNSTRDTLRKIQEDPPKYDGFTNIGKLDKVMVDDRSLPVAFIMSRSPVGGEDRSSYLEDI